MKMDRGLIFFFTIRFHVVMLDMVIIVRVPCMPNQWLDNIRERQIQPLPGPRQHSIVVNVVVQHQRRRSRSPRCMQSMYDAVQPSKMIEEVHCAWDCQAQMPEYVCEKDDIGRMSYDALGQIVIW